MIIQTHDGKQFDVPEENLERFVKAYNNFTGFDPRKLSPDPEVNPERGANLAGVARSAAQGLPVIGSYADEAEAGIRAAGDALAKEMLYQKEHENDPKLEPKLPGLTGKLMQGMEDYNVKQERYNEFFDQSYDKYLKNARESYEGAKKNIPEWAYPAEIGTGIVGEAGLAALTGGASLHPAVQGVMGAVYGYGMGEGDAINRGISSLAVGGASAALPLAGKYGVKYGVKKPLEYFGKKIANKEMPALTKALIKPNSVEKTVVSTDLSKATDAIIDNINKADVLPEEKPVIQTIVDALSNNSQKNAHLLLKDIKKAVMNAYEKSGLSPDSLINLKGAISKPLKTIKEANDRFTINNLRTLVNKGESIAEKTAVADDLLKNTTKVKSLYNTVNKDIDEMLALSWEDQLKDTFIDLQSKYADKFSQDVIQRLYDKVLSATANSAEQVIKDSSNDLITRNLTKEIKNIVASESGLSKEFAQGLEDRIISEVLSRRTAASLAGKSLKASSKGLIGSVALDATIGAIADAAFPGAGVPGALLRNVLMPSNSSLSRVMGALKNKAVDSVIAKNIARDNIVATIISANEKGVLNRFGENKIKELMKRDAKEAASRKTVGQKIVNALKPLKAVKEGYNEASKKPAKQLVKEALQVAPKTAIPVGIRETTREMYNEDAIPFAAKPKREEPLKQFIVEPKEVTQTVQQPVEIPKATMNPNNLSYNTIVLPGGGGDTSSSMEKFIRMIQALYPNYYQKVA